MEKFLSVGTASLNHQLFWPVDEPLNSKSIKPYGGLWLTLHEKDYYNSWVDLLTSHPHLLFFKYENPVRIPAVLVTLRQNARIFNLNNYDDFLFLKKNYPHSNFLLSYKAMAKDYDGVYFNLFSIVCDQRFSYEEQNIFRELGVESLVLFNLSCILYYQSSLVSITQINFDDPRDEVCYSIEAEKEKKLVTYPDYDIFLHNLTFKILFLLQQDHISLSQLNTYQLSAYIAEAMKNQIKENVNAYLETSSMKEVELIRSVTKKVREITI